MLTDEQIMSTMATPEEAHAAYMRAVVAGEVSGMPDDPRLARVPEELSDERIDAELAAFGIDEETEADGV